MSLSSTSDGLSVAAYNSDRQLSSNASPARVRQERASCERSSNASGQIWRDHAFAKCGSPRFGTQATAIYARLLASAFPDIRCQ
eukprot:6479663-Amphidinium_carterae.1